MSILVATDLSSEGNEAARVAGALALALGQSLRIVHVLEPRSTFPAHAGERVGDLEVVRNAGAHKLLKALAREVGGNVETDVLQGGVEDTLRALVQRLNPRIAVVGGFGDGKASYRGLADSLATLLPCPVLVVRPADQRLKEALSGTRRLQVFVAVDRTLASDAPIAFVKWLREHIACDVVVDYLYWPPTEHERLGVPATADPLAADPMVVRLLESELRERVGQLPGTGELTVRCHPNIGSVEILTKRAVEAFGSDMVIVGSHRRHGWNRFVHGSVSLAIMQSSDIPVVCVGHDVLGARDTTPRIRKVLVATDFSGVTRETIAHAIDLIGDRKGSINIVFVDDRPMDGQGHRIPGSQHRLNSLEASELRTKMRGFLPEEIDDERIQVITTVLEGGPAAEAILLAAARWNADAICMSSRGQGALDRFLNGSVATQVVNGASCPVMVVRTRKE